MVPERPEGRPRNNDESVPGPSPHPLCAWGTDIESRSLTQSSTSVFGSGCPHISPFSNRGDPFRMDLPKDLLYHKLVPVPPIILRSVPGVPPPVTSSSLQYSLPCSHEYKFYKPHEVSRQGRGRERLERPPLDTGGSETEGRRSTGTGHQQRLRKTRNLNSEFPDGRRNCKGDL